MGDVAGSVLIEEVQLVLGPLLGPARLDHVAHVHGRLLSGVGAVGSAQAWACAPPSVAGCPHRDLLPHPGFTVPVR